MVVIFGLVYKRLEMCLKALYVSFYTLIYPKSSMSYVKLKLFFTAHDLCLNLTYIYYNLAYKTPLLKKNLFDL